MAVTKTLVKSCNGANNNTLNGSYTLTMDEEINFSSSLTTTTPNQTFSFPGSISTSQVQVFFALAAVSCTIVFNTTNSTSTNAKSIVLSPGVPYSWDIDCGFANPFPAVAITNCYVSPAAPGELDMTFGVSV